ncbi:MAG: CocE/NonD family hydrolase [Actinomycetota bacterium]
MGLLTLAPLPGRAQVTILHEEHLITMSDGVRIYADVARPDRPERVPVLVVGSPYGGSTAAGGIAMDGAGTAAELYGGDVAVVVFHLRGTGASEGEFDNWGARTREDSIKMVDWAASEPWSNGSVATFGGSGTAPWQYAPLSIRHPAIKAAMIATTCIDFYRDCFHPGGASGPVIEAAGGLVAAGYAQMMEARTRLGLAANPTPPQQIAALATGFGQGALEDRDNDYWRLRAATEEVANWNVPILFAEGPYDIGGWNGVIEGFLRANNAWLNLNGGHSAPTQVREAYDQPEQVRFVRHFLLGEDNGFEDRQRVRLYTGLGSRISWSKAEMLLRDEAGYPFPGTEWTRMYLDAGQTGSAVSLNDGSLSLAPGADGADLAPVTNTIGPKSEMRLVLHVGSIPPLIRKQISTVLPPDIVSAADNALLLSDMRTEEPTALTYTTGVLHENVEISGETTARIFARSSVPDLDIVVRLTDVWPDGRSEWITDTRLRASMREIDPALSRYTPNGDIWRPWFTFDERLPLRSGEINEFLLHMQNTSMVFRAGHRIRLDFFPIGQAAADAVPAPGTFEIMRGPAYPSFVLLPVIPAGCDRSVPAFDFVTHPGPCADELAEALG